MELSRPLSHHNAALSPAALQLFPDLAPTSKTRLQNRIGAIAPTENFVAFI